MRPLITPWTESERCALYRLDSGAEVIQEAIGRQAPLRRALVLLSIAVTPGLSRLEIGNNVIGSDSAIQMDLLALGETDRHGRPGKKLIEHYLDAPFGRCFLYRLTAAGERVMERLEATSGRSDEM